MKPFMSSSSPIRLAQGRLQRGSIHFSLALTALLLVACGDDITELNANVGAVETSKDLPECTKDIAGQTAFITETHEFLGCDGSEWQSLSASAVSVGDNVCMSKSLSDDTGFEIFCNGEYIGTVRNGEKGEPGVVGKDGATGTGCEITESTALTATIACGSETFTMDLTGYVEQPAECDATLYEDCTGSMDNVSLSGVSQKGPFITGTDITAYELENGRSLKQTGKTFGGKIERADGTFDIKTIKLKSTFAYLVADGFYRNEVTGENSAATIKLRALTNLQGRTNANINLVTHLEYDRVQRLVTKEDFSVLKAKQAAEREIFAAFGIDNSGFKGLAEDYNILEEGDGNAALLAISALLQGDRTEAQLTALLASLSVDLGDNGQWDNEQQRVQIADWAMKNDLEGGLAKIRANVEGWKLSNSKAPAFEGLVTNFWTTELDVPACTENSAGRLFAVKNKNSAFYAENDSVYTKGDSSLVRLICSASDDSYAWRLATDFEKDLAALDSESDKDVVSGKINTGFVYVKEDGAWRRGTELDLDLENVCGKKNIGETDSMTVKHVVKWFICDESDDDDGLETVPATWREATTAEADTALFGVPQTAKDSVKAGNVDKAHVYVFENEGWRRGTDLDREEGLGGCITTRIDSVRQKAGANDADGWYKCVTDVDEYADGVRIPSVWRRASSYEVDMIDWELNKDSTGKLMPGKYSGKTVVWDAGSFREASETEIKLGKACVSYGYGTGDTLANLLYYTCTRGGWSQKGSFEDKRQYKRYQGVLIGRQTWMASNLNYRISTLLDADAGYISDSSSFCYGDSIVYRSSAGDTVIYTADRGESHCDKYGRLYTWEAARQACPSGWHLPSKDEWDELRTYVGGENVAAGLLKSLSGWNQNGYGTDDYAFSALPAGYKYKNGYYAFEGEFACFWSSTEDYGNFAYTMYFYYTYGPAYLSVWFKYNAYSVRCVSDIVLE